MIASVRHYFKTLFDTCGTGWNRFWFTPSHPATLCALRIITGCIAFYTHATLWPDVVRFFAAGGLLPVDAVQQVEGGPGGFSYLNYLSTPDELRIVHVLGLVAIGLFTVGLATRVSNVLALLVIVSDVNRAPMLTSQLEPALIMVLLYLCLGPSGRYLSVDQFLRRARKRDIRLPQAAQDDLSVAATVSLRLIQVHLAMLYGLMGLAKLMTEPWWNGLGVWWLMTRTESRLIDFTWLHDFPYVINFWTHTLVVFEISFALLIWNRLARPLLLAISFVMWPLVALLTGQVMFALMMLTANLAFISPEWLKANCRRCFGDEQHEPITPVKQSLPRVRV